MGGEQGAPLLHRLQPGQQALQVALHFAEPRHQQFARAQAFLKLIYPVFNYLSEFLCFSFSYFFADYFN
jgi:hypothetical protein